MISIATDDAVQMLEAGWTVRYLSVRDVIEWRSPNGISGNEWRSESLDDPPAEAVKEALKRGHIKPRHRH